MRNAHVLYSPIWRKKKKRRRKSVNEFPKVNHQVSWMLFYLIVSAQQVYLKWRGTVKKVFCRNRSKFKILWLIRILPVASWFWSLNLLFVIGNTIEFVSFRLLFVFLCFVTFSSEESHPNSYVDDSFVSFKSIIPVVCKFINIVYDTVFVIHYNNVKICTILILLKWFMNWIA